MSVRPSVAVAGGKLVHYAHTAWMTQRRPWHMELRVSTSGRATAASICICGGTEVVKWAVGPLTTQVTRANDALIVVVGELQAHTHLGYAEEQKKRRSAKAMRHNPSMRQRAFVLAGG